MIHVICYLYVGFLLVLMLPVMLVRIITELRPDKRRWKPRRTKRH